VSNLATVQEIYEALGRWMSRRPLPCLPTISNGNLGRATQQSTRGVPWMIPRHGRAEVVQFFEIGTKRYTEFRSMASQ
jgi:hypothetical protein